MIRLSWLAFLTFAMIGASGFTSLLASDDSSTDGPAADGGAVSTVEESESNDAKASAQADSEQSSAKRDKRSHSADEPNDVDADDALEFFSAMNKGQVAVKFIAKSDHAARMIITNNTKQPITLRMPEAFAGVPVVAQFGGGGGGGRGGGGGGGGFGGGGGGGQQSVGGGGGGMMGGGGGMGGGMFSIPPEQTKKINFPVVCLDHGLRDPSSSKPYRIVPADQHVAQPAVVELLKAFGRGELHHGAAQAAAWNLNSGVSWDELVAKRQGTVRTPSRQPYFTGHEIQAAMAYARESARLAEGNADQYRDFGKQKEDDRYSTDAVEEEGEEEEVSETTASAEELSAAK